MEHWSSQDAGLEWNSIVEMKFWLNGDKVLILQKMLDWSTRVKSLI